MDDPRDSCDEIREEAISATETRRSDVIPDRKSLSSRRCRGSDGISGTTSESRDAEFKFGISAIRYTVRFGAARRSGTERPRTDSARGGGGGEPAHAHARHAETGARARARSRGNERIARKRPARVDRRRARIVVARAVSKFSKLAF